jgi:hypothetical protein
MKVVKKTVSLTLTFAMLISILWVSPVISGASDLDPAKMTFEAYIVANIENFAKEIEISHYIHNNSAWLQEVRADANAFGRKMGDIIFDIINNNPHLFQVVTSLSFSYIPNSFSSYAIQPEYIITQAQHPAAQRALDAAVAAALDYARAATTDLEKAILLHDYIVLNTVYDVESLEYARRNNYQRTLRPNSHTAYGALVDGLAVCEGYTKAYALLLSKVGVESRFIAGNLHGGPHAWNIIKVGGSWYHVDVTANDPLISGFDMHGRVSHKYFLLSDAALLATRDDSGRQTHSDWVLPSGIRVNSTTYDRAFFRDVKTAIVKIGDSLYWIASTPTRARNVNNNSIQRQNSSGAISTVHEFESIWYRGGTENSSSASFDVDSYTSIAAHGNLLYFNTAKDIRSFDPVTGAVSVVHTPANLGGTGNRFIYGMTMSGNTITFTVKTQVDSANNLFTFTAASAATPPTSTPTAYTTLDVLTILQYSVGIITLTPQQREKYDLNNDGVINVHDALIALQIAVGVIRL